MAGPLVLTCLGKRGRNIKKTSGTFGSLKVLDPTIFFLHHCIISVWVLQALSDGCLFTLFLTSQEVYQQDWGHRGTKVGSMAEVKRSPTLRPIEDFVSMLTKHLKHLETHDPASPMEMLIVFVSSMMVFNLKAHLKFQEAGVCY